MKQRVAAPRSRDPWSVSEHAVETVWPDGNSQNLALSPQSIGSVGWSCPNHVRIYRHGLEKALSANLQKLEFNAFG